MSADDMHDKHLENVLAMHDPGERMNYFVTTVCGTEEVFGLIEGDEWVTFVEDMWDRSAFPVWPHARLAEEAAKAHWQDAEPQAIGLYDWIAFCDRIGADGGLIAVMWFPDDSFVRVEPKDLKRELEEWLREAYDPDAGPRY